nr:hypothetical protein CFP56_35499 [Quercus suber]
MMNNYKIWKFHGESAAATTATDCGSSQVQDSENLYGDFRGMLHDLCPPHEMPPEPMEEGPTTQHPAEGMGKKRRLPLVHVGEGPSHSRQRHEENLEATYTTPQARADACDVGTAPPGMQRDFPLTVVDVGGGSSRSPQSVQEELRATLATDQALGDVSDDETQPPSPEDLVQQTQQTSNVRAEELGQETSESSNGTKKRGETLMRKIWTLLPDKKIELPLNATGQPLGESRQTFIRWLGTFCICPAYCPLMPLNWTHVPSHHKDVWVEIQKKWIINPEILHPANQMPWAMHLLGELRRNRRTKLKKKCYPKDASKAEVLAKIPGWAEKQQYADLVDYWFYPDTEAKKSGQAIERAVVFKKVYSKKDETPISTDVEDKINKMTAILNNGGSLQGDRHQGILWDELAQAEQRHQEQIADMHAKHKEEIAELHAWHKEEVTEAIADAQRNILAQLQSFLNTLSQSQGSETITMSSLDDSSTYVLTETSSKPVIYIIIIEKFEKDKKNRFSYKVWGMIMAVAENASQNFENTTNVVSLVLVLMVELSIVILMPRLPGDYHHSTRIAFVEFTVVIAKVPHI